MVALDNGVHQEELEAPVISLHTFFVTKESMSESEPEAGVENWFIA